MWSEFDRSNNALGPAKIFWNRNVFFGAFGRRAKNWVSKSQKWLRNSQRGLASDHQTTDITILKNLICSRRIFESEEEDDN